MNPTETKLKRGAMLQGLLIDSMAAEGKCVARLPATQEGQNGLVVFVTGGAPGDTVDVEITKVKSHFLEAKVKAVISFSSNRSNGASVFWCTNWA